MLDDALAAVVSTAAPGAAAGTRPADVVHPADLDDAATEGWGGPVAYELALAEVAVEQAQVSVAELALSAAQQLFETVGASATSTAKGLDRHWRNAQTVATHNPLAFRARAIGDYHLNGVLPEGQYAVGDAPWSTQNPTSTERTHP